MQYFLGFYSKINENDVQNTVSNYAAQAVNALRFLIFFSFVFSLFVRTTNDKKNPFFLNETNRCVLLLCFSQK